MRLLAFIFLLGCTGAPPADVPDPPADKRPDVVIITLDTTRADRLGCYGDPLARTPNLDALAQDAVLFRQATTPVPLTLPAHTSLFSGWYPARHGLRDNGGFSVRPEVPLLAETLSKAGYQTGGFVAAYVLDGSWGIDRGFSTYYDEFHPEDVRRATRFGAVERPAREVVRQALAWWDEAAKKPEPRFLWVHLFDAHTPYEPPVDWTGDPYRGEIFEMDRALRPLLASLPDDALVIVASDHGENLWDGRELEHGTVLTRSTLRIPLLIRPPGGIEGVERPDPVTLPPRPAAWTPVPGLGPDGLVLDAVVDAPVAGRVVETPVSLVDVTPTIEDLLGLPVTAGDGRSLSPSLQGKSLPDTPVYSESVAPFTHFGWAPQFVSRDGERLLRRDTADELFDPVADPWWQGPLAQPAPDALTQQVDRQSDGWERPGGPIDAETAQVLGALGYARSAARPDSTDRPSARTHIDRMHRLHLAQGVMFSQPEHAIKEFEALVTEDPDLVDAWFGLGTMRWRAQDIDGAVAALNEVVERAPDHPLAWNNLIVLMRDNDRVDEALKTAMSLAQAHPRDGRWHRHVVHLLGTQERPREVAAAAEKGLEGLGPDPYLYYMLGLARGQLDDPKGAIEALNASKKAGTEAMDVDLWIGQAYHKLGDVDGAVKAWKDQANRTPEDPRAMVAAAIMLWENDRCGEAMPLLFNAMERGVRDARVQQAYKACTGQ